MTKEEMNKLKDNLKKHQEDLNKDIKTLQTETAEKFENLDADLKAKHEAIVASMDEKLSKIDEISTKLENEEKRRQELEEILSRLPEHKGNENGEIFGNPELKSAFRNAVLAEEKVAMSKADREATAIELMKTFLPHMSEEDIAIQAKAMYVGSNPDGGYLCPAEQTNKIIQRVFETSDIRQVASQMTTIRESVKIPIDDGDIGAGWINELGNRSETATPKLGVQEIATHELYAFPMLTLKLLEDSSQNLENWIATKVGDKFSRVENTAFISGDGIDKPKGILSYEAWDTMGAYERDKLETLISKNTGSIVASDLQNLQALQKEAHIKNSKWGMARKIFVEICKIKEEATSGAFLINPKLLFEGARPQILGSEVKMFEDMPKVLTSGAKNLLYADFSAYQIVDRLGISLIRDNTTKIGWLKLYFRKRVGGDVVDFDKIKVFKMK